MFKDRRSSRLLMKGSLTGIAASVVDGRTLHNMTMMGISGPGPSQATPKKLSALWKEITYLIIDEISMASRDFFAKLAGIVATAKQSAGSGDASLPFGGVNVILVGVQVLAGVVRF
jgi:hypothetical protein